MGLLIPTPDDRDIVRRLTRRFNRKNLARLRAYQSQSGDQLFATGRTLRRIAWRLRLWPVTTPSDRPRARWFKFLRDLTPATREQIRQILFNEIADLRTSKITFEFVEDTSERATVAYRTDNLNTSKRIAKLKLFIIGPMDASDPGDPGIPPADGGEGNGDPGDEPDEIEIDKASKKHPGKKSPVKKAATKKKTAKKKAAKKKTKRR